MTHLTLETKEAIVIKALNRGAETIESIAKSNNVGLSTLQKWLRRYREGMPLSSKTKNKGKAIMTREEQFQHILATSGLDVVSLGKYCRENGLYSHELTQWRESFMKTPSDPKSTQDKAELKVWKDKCQQLERELRRKEKALAEASALLVLKKKADLIWGVNEDD